MSHQINWCPLAQYALNLSSTIQTLVEAGYKILGTRLANDGASLFIAHSHKTKLLRGVSTGIAFQKGMKQVVYQSVINGVAVRWLEPDTDAQFITQSTAQKVH